ncbi:MAG: hypothetical protein AB7U85_05455 [Alphaproteobacteria bacterium]
MMLRVSVIAIALLILTGCSGQKVFVWEKAGTGVYQFGEDHQYCMRKADFFPWRVPKLKDLFEKRRLELRARWEDSNGIWASYVPYEGADAVTVNYDKRSNMVSSTMYKSCMKKKGYVQNKSVNYTSNIK